MSANGNQIRVVELPFDTQHAQRYRAMQRRRERYAKQPTVTWLREIINL